MGAVEDARFGGIDLSPWAKYDHEYDAPYPALFHMLDVAAIAVTLWDSFLSPSQRKVIAEGLGLAAEDAQRVTAFLAGLHDLGKLSRFQMGESAAWARLSQALQDDAAGWRRVPHERASMHAAVELLAEIGYETGGNDSPAVRAAQTLGGHHGRYLQLDLRGAASPGRVRLALGGLRWFDLRRRYLRVLRHLTGAQAVPLRFSVPAAVLITGVGMVADRLASQRHHWLPKALAPAFGAAEHYALACKVAPEVVERAGLSRVCLSPASFAAAHPGAPAPNPLQASVLEDLPAAAAARGAGILTVTDATGGGKSVTALEAARIFNAHCGSEGICWLMPTTATADAAWETLERYVAAHQPEHAPVTLVHSHRYLNTVYSRHLASTARAGSHAPDPAEQYPDDTTRFPSDLDDFHDNEADEIDGGAGERPEAATVPDGWVRGQDRALLAQFSTATIDQALIAVLPVRHSALRMLALSGKTVVIDEAHAFAPFTQLQLRRLLHWLGALGAPVVLLSATLPASTCDDLVRSYLTGAGHRPSALAGRSFAPAYPGWVFADAATATPHAMHALHRRAHTSRYRRSAHLTLQPVRHQPLGGPGRAVAADERLARIATEIAPVVDHGGYAAVVCATVADAQDTYRHLRTALPWAQEEALTLLHSRFPGHHREAVTSRVRNTLGPAGPRPGRGVVVTTSLLDTGLDIDVDLMISDLASLARLLQRLGRLWRFERHWGVDAGRRPAWARDQGARLMALHPVDRHGATRLPAGWRAVEPPFLQHATAELLAEQPDRTLTLPDDVQHLVEHVHGAESEFARATEELRTRHAGHLAAEEHLSAAHLIPPPGRISSLAELHRQHLTAATAATRLGTLPKRLLPCYRTPSGALTFDAAGDQPLPTGPLTSRQIRTLLTHTVPVPAAWVAHRSPTHLPPTDWLPHPLLNDLTLLPHDTTTLEPQAQTFGRHHVRFDPHLGLIHREG